ncbi:hypothetical protein DUNSADRAFT_5349 [Dunaliella salina]|uniref:Encoded protein n=1 Tax=Dunaliella salina TaxID=3046 RepID=A0ABQ7GQN7_DUNSA|nr:hypothetical protein DUNSADRAFT_5349 [Dunaliella salina]|eukprot:KAF5836858.1 hypothetical protein DUNSADRAFT_5349 [Dunaliella salina]
MQSSWEWLVSFTLSDAHTDLRQTYHRKSSTSPEPWKCMLPGTLPHGPMKASFSSTGKALNSLSRCVFFSFAM